MAAPTTGGMENEPKENSNKTMVDSSGRGRGVEQTARVSSEPVQMIGGALKQTVHIELADKPTVRVDSTRKVPQEDGIALHPNPAVAPTAIAALKDQSGDRAAAPFAEEAPVSHGRDRETELPEERSAAIDQQGDVEIGPGQSQANPENHKNTGADNKTKTTNPSILLDGITKQPEHVEEDKRVEGRGDAMEVDIHQTMTEETPATDNASTTTKVPQPAEAAPPTPKKMISYYEWRKRHHLWLNSLMRQALGEQEGPEIPDLSNLRYPIRLDPEHHANVEPRRQFIRRYDLRIVVAEAKDPVEAYRQALTEWFNKILEIDEDAVIYPWTAVDRQAGTTVIKDPDKLPTTLSNLKKYTPKIWL